MSGAILWDFDGTLAQRPGRWGGCLHETLEAHEPGHGVTREAIRPHLWNGFPWHAPETPHPELSAPGAWWEHVEQLLARAYVAVGFAEVRARELAALARERYVDGSICWELCPDVVPSLERLRALGWRHVIVSNHVPELETIVGSLGLRPFFDAVVTSAEIGYEKPHPETFAAGRRAAGDPEQLWMVGDNPIADVEGAEAAGIPAILVRATQHSAARCASSLEEIEGFVGSPGRVGLS